MNSEEFHAKVKNFAKLNPQMLFIIETVPKEDHARQERARAAWLAYLTAKGLRNAAGTWKAIWAGGGKAVTTPSEDPCMFDLSYNPSGNASRTGYGGRWQERTPSPPKAYRED
jgi:hypothetical protein